MYHIANILLNGPDNWIFNQFSPKYICPPKSAPSNPHRVSQRLCAINAISAIATGTQSLRVISNNQFLLGKDDDSLGP